VGHPPAGRPLELRVRRDDPEVREAQDADGRRVIAEHGLVDPGFVGDAVVGHRRLPRTIHGIVDPRPWLTRAHPSARFRNAHARSVTHLLRDRGASTSAQSRPRYGYSFAHLPRASCFESTSSVACARRTSFAWPSSASTSRFCSRSATYPDGKPSLNQLLLTSVSAGESA